jgi:hypothetical protein
VNNSNSQGGGGVASDTIYCTWVSGEIEYFDISIDPWEINNLVEGIRDSDYEKDMIRKLAKLKGCDGREDCENV